jgi:hypothetical protein
MKVQELSRLTDLNIELMDSNRNLMSYLIQVYERNGITHDEFSHAKSLLSQVSKVLQNTDKPSNRGLTGQKNNRKPNISLYP